MLSISFSYPWPFRFHLQSDHRTHWFILWISTSSYVFYSVLSLSMFSITNIFPIFWSISSCSCGFFLSSCPGLFYPLILISLYFQFFILYNICCLLWFLWGCDSSSVSSYFFLDVWVALCVYGRMAKVRPDALADARVWNEEMGQGREPSFHHTRQPGSSVFILT